MRILRYSLATLLAITICAGSALLAKPVSPSTQTESPATYQLNRADAEAWLDGLMPALINSYDIAGAVVVVVKDGQILTQKGYGFSNISKGTAVDPEKTLFRPGSVSKLFTWTAIMQLVEQGKVDLDADINKYLDFKVTGRGGKIITVRHLMTHRAGFEESVRQLILVDQPNMQTGNAVLKRWTPKRIFDPGTTPAYSNYATGLAGYIVERVSGISFETYIERNIFQPLGMNHSSFRQPLPDTLKPMMSKGYPSATGDGKGFEFINMPAAGSLASPGTDMARFMIAHLQLGKFGTVQILKPETARLMHESATSTIAPLRRIMLGFYEKNVNGHRVIGHGGSTAYFYSDLSLFLDDNVGIFVSFNSAGTQGGGKPRKILFNSFADRYFPSTSKFSAVDPVGATQDSRRISGVYSVTRRSQSSFLNLTNLLETTDIVANNDGAIIVNPGAGETHLVHIGPMLWQEKNGKERLAAKIKNSVVTEFAFDSTAPFITFQRLPDWRSGKTMSSLLGAAIGILLLAGLSWPVSAVVRRYYKAPFPYTTSSSARAYRSSRIFAFASIVIIALWAGVSSVLGEAVIVSDTQLLVLQWLSLLVFVGMLITALWHLNRIWRDNRSWLFKLSGVLLTVSAFALCCFAYAGGLFSMTSNY
jgi:CubicO group peptidase (beta-lactamase class C family)